MSVYLNKKIEDIYNRLNIKTIDNFDVESIVNRLSIIYHYADGFSRSIVHDGEPYIFIDKYLSFSRRWEVYGHELGHIVLHAGYQRDIPRHFTDQQEREADLFSYLFCVPQFLLKEVVLEPDCGLATSQVSEIFGVTLPFAHKRLEIYKKAISEGESSYVLS